MPVAVAFNDQGSYHRCNLTGTGKITLEELYQELYILAGDAETYMTKADNGDGTFNYTLKIQISHLYVQLYINANVHFHMDNAGDTLGIDYHPTSSATYTVLFSALGSIFEMEEGCVLDYDSNSSTFHRAYSTFYGQLLINGTEENPVIWNEARTNHIYPQTDNESLANSINHLTVNSGTVAGGYSIIWGAATISRSANLRHSYTNIIAQAGANPNSGILFWGGLDYRNQIFDNIKTYDLRDIFINGGRNLTISNSKFEKTYSLINIQYTSSGGSALSSYSTSKENKRGDNKNTAQSITHFKNCHFIDNSNFSATEYGISLYYGALAYFEDCIFEGEEDPLARGLYPILGSFAMVKNPVFINVGTNYVIGADSSVVHVLPVEITVLDSSGNPIEDASVTVRQKEGKETHTFITLEDGKVETASEKTPVFVEKEQTTNTATVNWSDGVADRVHIIEVFKVGYKAYSMEFTVAAVSANGIIVALEDELEEEHNTKVINSTIYNSTIY